MGHPYHETGVDYNKENYTNKQRIMDKIFNGKYPNTIYLKLNIEKNKENQMYFDEKEYMESIYEKARVIRNAIKNTTRQRVFILVISHVCIKEYTLQKHAKCLIYDKLNQTFYFIDPLYKPNRPYSYEANSIIYIENIVYCTMNQERRFSYANLQNRKKVKKNLRLKQSTDLYKKNFGLQTKEMAIHCNQEVGFCLPWTYLLGEIILSNPEIEIEYLMKILSGYSAKTLKTIIRGYIMKMMEQE
jgi:hypothetical protein